ncbi:hypothetical protein [Allofournierella sp. CML151]|nr:hypothetical protein [Fournierella sp. CML151]
MVEHAGKFWRDTPPEPAGVNCAGLLLDIKVIVADFTVKRKVSPAFLPG